MEKDLNEIDEIAFGVYSEEEIKKIAVCEVNNPKLCAVDKNAGMGTVYDPRMGILQNNIKCPTCNQGAWGCPGHMGYIQLNECIVHPMFYRQVVNLLRCFCIKCYGLLLTEDQLILDGLTKYKGMKRLDKIMEKLEKIDICPHCKKIQPSVKYAPIDNAISFVYKRKEKGPVSMILSTDDIKKTFDNISDEHVRLLGFNPELMHPRNLILTVFPVISVQCRPYVVTDGNFCDDDLTIQLTEIIKVNNHLAMEDGKPVEENKRQKYLQLLKARIGAFYNNSGVKVQTTNGGKPINGLKQRLSGKAGIIRSSLLAKRCEQTGRTVIGPAPHLKLGQLGIPEEMANTLTIPVHVTKHNIDFLSKLIEQDRIVSVAINKGKTNIVIPHVTNYKGTRLLHGDIIVRNDKEIIVMDPKITLQLGDKLKRDGKFIDVEYPCKRPYTLNIGDICDRRLINGDIVAFNPKY